jgi:uncharacterized protein YfeS
MTKPLLLSCLLLFSFIVPGKSQDNGDKFEFSPNSAKPNARALMKEDFFWSPIDESGPFGSDGGSDAAYGFHIWRKTHSSISPIIYLKDLVGSWHYPEIAWDEMDTAKIGRYMKIPYTPSQSEIEQQVNLLKQQNKKYQNTPGAKQLSDEEIHQIIISSGKNMGARYLIDLDEAIVGTAFAQFVLEGKIDPRLKYYVTKTLEREMLNMLTRQFGQPEQQQGHSEKMIKLLQVVRKMPS